MANGEDISTDVKKTPKKGRREPVITPFSPATSSLSKEYTTILNQTGDQCAYTMQVFLKQYLRLNIEVLWQGIEFMLFRDYINMLPAHCCIHILRSENMEHYSLYTQEIDTIAALMERLLGARSLEASKKTEFEFTNINSAVISRLSLMMLREVQQAFKNILTISWQIDRQESNPMLASVLPDKENVIVLNFKVRGDVPEGFLRLCIAAMDLRSPLEQYKRRMATTAHQAKKNSPIDKHLYKSKVIAALRLGQINLKCQELRQLSVGDIVQLDKPVNSPVHLYVGNHRKYEGRIGKVENNWAFIVDENISGDKI